MKVSSIGCCCINCMILMLEVSVMPSVMIIHLQPVEVNTNAHTYLLMHTCIVIFFLLSLLMKMGCIILKQNLIKTAIGRCRKLCEFKQVK